ncbi:DNA polymerase family A-domain-containing protein [Hysterangium stoloniferum]|nr:DNA polymerase family A-domain-containing protein [Hysterangium stoloniferum]
MNDLRLNYLLGPHSRQAKLKIKTPPQRRFPRLVSNQLISVFSAKYPNNTTAKRNEVGVQLLSTTLHSQIFKNVAFPAPEDAYIQIARDHLAKHKLDPSASSTHPDVSFTLPPLQGPTIDAHFHALGAQIAQPYLSMSQRLASLQLPPQPDSWVIQSGWTKYWPDEDGLHEAVECPDEELLVFDVETLPNYSPFAIMACAASPTAWYAWISPWLLNETTDPEQLVPLGDPTKPRIVVGHNISYDRARTLEEYRLERPGTRWLDTMALHIAVNGISSHQRPAWSQYRKRKIANCTMKDEAVESVTELIANLKQRALEEVDKEKRRELKQQAADLFESLPSLEAIHEVGGEEEEDSESAKKRWEDSTAANSLADVARLHCGIEVDKSTRSDFMKLTPEAILADLPSYLTYCASDVAVTHEVFRKTLPAFLERCPNPVSFAGMCSMGSSFLPVNETWEEYLRLADEQYHTLDNKVVLALRKLAEEARQLCGDDRWKGDVWMEQLDWTPKSVRSSGIDGYEEAYASGLTPIPPPEEVNDFGKQGNIPKFLNDLQILGPSHPYVKHNILPYLLRLQLVDRPVRFVQGVGWHSLSGNTELPIKERIISPGPIKIKTLLDPEKSLFLLKTKKLSSKDGEGMRPWLAIMSQAKKNKSLDKSLDNSARRMIKSYVTKSKDWEGEYLPWAEQLEWTPVKAGNTDMLAERGGRNDVIPKWYWQLGKAGVKTGPENLDITVRSRVAPLLLRLKWQGWPMFYSREHGWTFRVERAALTNKTYTTRQKELSFYEAEDETLKISSADDGEFAFFKLPHKDGETANVGNPMGKTFIKFATDGTLSSPQPIAGEALEVNAQCSYWISARDRITKQIVVWDRDGRQGLQALGPSGPGKKWGIILPQVITMGTVTRRAIEKTWLTASNAKKNRIGSELKAMVRAPEGYAIVGADVDSEELWISSCMGDAQFGLHGATAIGWMTLEGTKKAGTDLHSKTASILGISRDQAKVFNYSRIYGAGMKHAMLLLMQGNAAMLPEQAQKLAEQLYSSTKGKNTHRPDMFGGKFWYGGTESYVFNKLEQIALSDEPKTPALGCGVTYALSKQYLPEKFGADYLPSRINWVVQSSGVDYLHLLIVSMEHLLQAYNIDARYLISVHDELRYLVKEEDKYRAALALQIANLWTRSMFAYRLGMDDLPQGVAFFSAVDVDKVLRKEVDMACVTPSQPIPIPPGETLDIQNTLEKTNGGTLWKDGRPMEIDALPTINSEMLKGYVAPDCLVHRAKNARWLRAQATDLPEEVKFLAEMDAGKNLSNMYPKKGRGKTSESKSKSKSTKSVTKKAAIKGH